MIESISFGFKIGLSFLDVWSRFSVSGAGWTSRMMFMLYESARGAFIPMQAILVFDVDFGC